MEPTRAEDAPPLPGSQVASRVPLSRLLAWGSYDWGAAAFQAVITTFVFATYVSSAVAPEDGALSGATWISLVNALSAVAVALSAAVLGQRADRLGRRKRYLMVFSVLVWVAMALMFLVRPEAGYLAFALLLLGLAGVFMELANVSYNAMLQQVSTPQSLGRVSGFGWSLGYFGGIVLLLICYVGFIAPEVGWFGVTSEGGLNIRTVALLAAGWFVVFGLPIFFLMPESAPDPDQPRLGLLGSYRVLLADLRVLWRTDRNAVRFLVASALYRDGLAAIFSLGAVLAVTVYGLGADDVLVFGIAANVLAALGAVAGGFVEDRLGARTVILASIAAMVVAGTSLLFVSGPAMFWVFGLLLTIWVGPAQASSRSLLTRLAPAGHEGQMFGLYTSTGRAISFLAPALFALFAVIGSDRTGIIGIVLVLLAGGLVMLGVRAPGRPAAVPQPTRVG